MTTGGFQPGDFAGYPNAPRTQPATLLPRFFARLIDGILVSIAAVLLAVLLDTLGDVLVTGLFSGLLTFAYFVGFEVTQGVTPGKKLLNLRVLGAAGAPKPTLSQSATRNAFTLLAIVPFVGGLLALIAYIVIAVTIQSSPTNQGKHDELAGGTQVVKD